MVTCIYAIKYACLNEFQLDGRCDDSSYHAVLSNQGEYPKIISMVKELYTCDCPCVYEV
jgi:hypothetical protein